MEQIFGEMRFFSIFIIKYKSLLNMGLGLNPYEIDENFEILD